jgi:hypothetical protein
VKAAERAIQAQLRRMEVQPAESLLATALLDLAQRLDAGPGDRAAAMLVREMRLVMAELSRQTKGEANGDLERFLEAVSTPAFRGPGD